jgi:hypothetical protein
VHLLPHYCCGQWYYNTQAWLLGLSSRLQIGLVGDLAAMLFVSTGSSASSALN